ncbi:conserved Plasmodium protein, unknown function [Plasmodium gaboni]|uniref:Uncharacterized protein n=1 Tax=Plasmodium gaboni TaxID=647221 RepID=A0ABY1URK8_9APIC|nr:conserved Plasmodium protein, unknown function [Plasmodium gaboni]
MEERNVLEYAELIIDRQRDKINELEKKLEELRSSSEELQKNVIKNDEENKTLRLELNRRNDNDMILSMQMNKENELLEKMSFLEKQILKRDTLLEELKNLIKKRKYEYELLLEEKDNLKNTINTLRNDLYENRKNEKLKEQEVIHNEKENEKFLNLYKNNNEELNITKRCLIQIESELNIYKKQNENQKNEIQKLYRIITCMNREKTLIPPVVLALQNEYNIRTTLTNKKEYTPQIKDIQDESSIYINTIKNNKKKLTTLSPIHNKINHDKGKRYDDDIQSIYDNNEEQDKKDIIQNNDKKGVSKLNFIESQEQKNLYNKILQVLNNLQDKNLKDDNKSNFFFFSSILLHYCKSSSIHKSTYEINISTDHSNSDTAQSVDTFDNSSDSHFTYSSSGRRRNNSKRTNHKKKNKKYAKLDNTKERNKLDDELNKKDGKKEKIKNKNYPKNNSLSESELNENSDENMGDSDYSTNFQKNKMRTDSSSSDTESNTNSNINMNSNTTTNNEYDYDDDDDDDDDDNYYDKDNIKMNNKKTYPRGDNNSYLIHKDNKNKHRNKKMNLEKERKFLLNRSNYAERFIGVTSKQMYIYNDKCDDEPEYVLRIENLKNIKILYNNQIYELEYMSFNNIIEKHYIFIKNYDKCIRMFYALQYAGFIKTDMKNFIQRRDYHNDNILNNIGYRNINDPIQNQQIKRISNKKRKDKINYQDKEEDEDEDEVKDEDKDEDYFSINQLDNTTNLIRVNIFTPNGVDKNGNNVPYLSNNILLKAYIKDNILLFTNFVEDDNKYFFKCDKYYMKYKNGKFILYFNDFKDQHIVIAQSKDENNILYNMLYKMKWNNTYDENIINDQISNHGNIDNERIKDSRMSSHTSNRNIEGIKSDNDDYHHNSKDIYDNKSSNIYEKDKDNQRSSKDLSSFNQSDQISDSRKNDSTSNVSNISDDNEGDNFFIKDNVLYISKNGKGFKNDLSNVNEENAFKFETNDLIVIRNDELKELTFMKNKENRNADTYIFDYPKKEKYDQLVSELCKHNFNITSISAYEKIKNQTSSQKEENTSVISSLDEKSASQLSKKGMIKDKIIENNQVVVIEKGMLSIYKHYGNESSVPIIKYTCDFCDVQANEQNGEIIIKDTSKDSSERIVLDCLNKTEFNRWKTALCFGGFLKGEHMSNTYMNLKKHIFSINIFDNYYVKNLVKVENNCVNIYPNDKFIKPLFSFDKEKIELVLMPELRKIRIYLQRDTIYEQRYDITMSLARDYLKIKEDILKSNFHMLNQKKTQKIKKPFILCKKNIIAIHKDKYNLKPELLLNRKNCMVKIDKNNFSISFLIKSQVNKNANQIKTIKLANIINFNKWMVTLKLASFIPAAIDYEDNISFPSITFGHTCPEAISLIKRRSSLMDFFRINFKRKAPQAKKPKAMLAKRPPK